MAVKLFGTPRELHGSRARANGAFNLALVAEGYTEAEHQAGLFWTDADKLVQELKKTPPFSTFVSLLNVFGVPAISQQSGQSIATRCPAQADADRKTAFKVQFCVGNSPRSVHGEESLVKQVVRVDAGLPFVDQFLVIVNSKLYGGFGPNGIGWLTTSGSDWPRTAVHELGHSAFGLTDEYEDDEPGDPPTAFTGTEPAGPNVTADLALPTFKWRSLVQSFVPWPSTVPSGAGACTFNHPRAPGVAADAIGAFEGGAHRACNVYRPAFQCKMRDHADPFCAVCARQIVPTMLLKVVRESNPTSLPLSPLPGQSAIWTHVVVLPDPARPGTRGFLLLYDAKTGDYELRDAYQTIVQANRVAVVFGKIERDLTCFVPTIFAGQLELTAYRFAPSARIQYRIGPKLAPIQKIREDGFPLPVPTHAALVTRGADQLVLSYNRLTGSVVLEQLGPAGQTPTILAAEQWELNWTIVAPLRGWAESFVFCYEWRSGNYAIRALPAMFGGTPAPVWSSPGNSFPLVRQMTHALPLAHGAGLFVVGYSALNGMGSVYGLRSGGRGLDFLARLELDPGAPMMPSLGQGLAALDTIHVLPPGQTTTDPPWFQVYSQALGRALLFQTFGQ